MSCPSRIRRRAESLQIADWNGRPPLGHDSMRAQLSFQKNAARRSITPDAKLGASVRSGPVEDIELFGIEVDAGDAVRVTRTAFGIRIGMEPFARPPPDFVRAA